MVYFIAIPPPVVTAYPSQIFYTVIYRKKVFGIVVLFQKLNPLCKFR